MISHDVCEHTLFFKLQLVSESDWIYKRAGTGVGGRLERSVGGGVLRGMWDRAIGAWHGMI